MRIYFETLVRWKEEEEEYHLSSAPTFKQHRHTKVCGYAKPLRC